MSRSMFKMVWMVIDRIMLFLVKEDIDIANTGSLHRNLGCLAKHISQPKQEDNTRNQTSRQRKRQSFFHFTQFLSLSHSYDTLEA